MKINNSKDKDITNNVNRTENGQYGKFAMGCHDMCTIRTAKINKRF